MIFPNVKVKGVKSDIVKGDITVTLTMDRSELRTAEELAQYVGEDAGTVTVDITPRQMTLITASEEADE